MALISNYLSVGSGLVTGFDITVRDVRNALYQTVGTPTPYYEYRIVEVTEFVGLTEQCAKDLSATQAKASRWGYAVQFPSNLSRTVSCAMREDDRTIKSYTVTRSVETAVDIQITEFAPPSVSVDSGKKTYPFNVTINMAENATLVGGAYYVMDLYGTDGVSQGGVLSQNQSLVVAIPRASILLCGGYDAQTTPSNPVWKFYS